MQSLDVFKILFQLKENCFIPVPNRNICERGKLTIFKKFDFLGAKRLEGDKKIL